jgi:chromosome segregation ATPase
MEPFDDDGIGQYEEELSATKAEYGSKLEIAQQEALQEASQRHSSELAQLKDNSKKTIEEFLASHQAELESIKASHQKELESATAKTTSSLQSLQTDLSAASQDLSKAKWRNQELEATLKDMAANLQAAKEAQEAASKVEAPKDNKAEQKLLQLEQSLNAVSSNRSFQRALMYELPCADRPKAKATS